MDIVNVEDMIKVEDMVKVEDIVQVEDIVEVCRRQLQSCNADTNQRMQGG